MDLLVTPEERYSCKNSFVIEISFFVICVLRMLCVHFECIFIHIQGEQGKKGKEGNNGSPGLKVICIYT